MTQKKPLVPGHGSYRNTCKRCAEPHSINQHRFHTGATERQPGTGPFCRSHKKHKTCLKGATTDFFNLERSLSDLLKVFE